MLFSNQANANTRLIPRDKFREDINGLRALAVIAVVLYHFRISGFQGGFIGVDIFFVISGYLMTSIILSSSETDQFSLSGFYLARAKRIVPALLAMAAILLIVGWFLPLTPYEYKQLAKHVRDSALFVSNHTYSRESGYFDTSSHEKWLLHTWSLSVEWQFYLALPLIVLALKKLRPTAKPGNLLTILLIASLLACIDKTDSRPVMAFFLLPFRAWELLAGGLIYAFANQPMLPKRLVSGIVGISLILLISTTLLLSSSVPWPGWRALFPVLLTCLIIAGRHEENPLLANPVARWIGLRSYSIYLWHWPLVVGLEIYGLQDNTWATLSAIGATLIMGSLSYRLVEIPARTRANRVPAQRLWMAFAFAFFALVVPASWLQGQDALPLRTHAQSTIDLLTDEPVFDNPSRPECFNGSLAEGCRYGNGPVGAIMIGDSHASVTVTSALRIASTQGQSIQFWGKGACMTVLDIESIDRAEGARCMAFNQDVYSRIVNSEKNLPILIVNRASLYPFGLYRTETHLNGRPQAVLPGISPENHSEFLNEYRRRLIDTACRYAQNRRNVFYMLPIPEFNVNVPNELARSLMRSGKPPSDITITLAEYHRRNEFVIAALKEASVACGISLLDPRPYLCDDEKCYGSRNGQPLYTDNNHINERGRRLLAPMFKAVFREKPQL